MPVVRSAPDAPSLASGPTRFHSVHAGVLSAIGLTPTVRLGGMEDLVEGAALHAKLEFLNPGGSSKDRPAVTMLKEALADGRLEPGGLVVESSSGNMGIGLAQAARSLGLRFICVVDAKTTATNLSILRMLGADVEVVSDPDPATGEFLHARMRRVEEILEGNPEAFWTDQHNNPANAAAHCSGTAAELVGALGEPPDYMLVPTGTCGSLAGFQQFFRTIEAHTQLIAVDAEGSALFGPPAAGRLIPGLGSGNGAAQGDREGLHVEYVSNQDCAVGCHLLAQREAMLVGGSSGGAAVAALRLVRRVGTAVSVAMLFPDRGERYLDTIFHEAWLTEHAIDLGDGMREFRG